MMYLDGGVPEGKAPVERFGETSCEKSQVLNEGVA